MARTKSRKTKKAKDSRRGKMSRPAVESLPTVGLPESARLKKEIKKADPAKDMAEARTANADVNQVREMMRVSEFLVVMRHDVAPEEVKEVIEAVRSEGGKVVQRYPPRIIIGQHRKDITEQLLDLDGVSAVYTSPEELGLERVGLRDRAGLLVLRAWVLRHTAEYRAAKATRRIEGRILPDQGCDR